MKTVEFETKIENGIIKIPEKINKDIDNKKVKILINIKSDTNIKTNYDVNKIEKILEKISAKDIFQDIKDPVKWQKRLRNEWE